MTQPQMDMEARLNRAQAARWFRINPSRISGWKAAGLIAPVETTPGGQTLYRLRDLIDVERSTRQSQKSSRNPWRGTRRPVFP